MVKLHVKDHVDIQYNTIYILENKGCKCLYSINAHKFACGPSAFCLDMANHIADPILSLTDAVTAHPRPHSASLLYGKEHHEYVCKLQSAITFFYL